MKTVLDLLCEFITLNETRLNEGEDLTPEAQVRWEQLKKFYNVLMSHNGVTKGNLTRRFVPAEIREQLPRRRRLRVPVAMEIVFEHHGEYQSGRVLNLSCGGVFLASETILDIDSPLTLYLANLGRGMDALIAVDGEVAWNRKPGESGLPPGMGVRFINVPESVQLKLDSFVLETIEKQLCGLSASLLDTAFLEQEQIEL